MSAEQTTEPIGQAVAIQSLVKTYGHRKVVNSIDVQVRSGEVFGLIGPNGAGKSTAVEIIAGLRKPSAGSVRVLGLNPATQRHQLTKKVSVQPQTANLFPTLTVSETLVLFASFYDYPLAPGEVLSLLGLDDSHRVRVKNLSGGQTRRLLIGLAIIGRPSLVILDEPSAGLDPVSRRELWKLIRSLRDHHTTVLLTTHHMDEAMELCDRVAIMAAGSIVAEGPPQQIVAEHSATSTVKFIVPAGVERSAVHEIAQGAPTRITEIPKALLVAIDTNDPHALLSRVTMHSGIRATGVQIETGTLEDVFLKLVGEPDQGDADSGPRSSPTDGSC